MMIVEKSKSQLNCPQVLNGINTPIYNYYSLFKRNIVLVCRLKLLIVAILWTSFAFAQPPEVNPNGYNVFFYPNGTMSSEGNMRDGKPDGYWKTYFENGQLKSEGNRIEFQLDGPWIFYTDEGVKQSLLTYAADQKNGEELIFGEAGNVLERYNYVDDKKSGEAIFYYDSGEIYRTLTFENNLEEGKGFEYAKDGRLITFLNYQKGYIRSIEKVNRMNKAGQKKGFWIEYWPNGRTREEGNWTNGVRNGLFKFYTKKGDLDRIEVYRGGELVEDADETIVLDIRKEYYEDGTLKIIGSYKDGSKQGVFREYDKDGNIINSYVYENNTRTGEGIVDKKGKNQGNWKLFYPSGELKATGQYIDGKKEGEWIFYFKSGKIEQKGNYASDLTQGPWKWWYDDGAVLREERFRKGKEDGLMIEYDREGNEITKGEFIDGMKTGPWFYTVNDYTEVGDYLDDERHGEWKATYDNDKPYFEGEYQAGVPLDKHSWYYRNGNLKEEGKYKGGEKHGTWRTFTPDGLVDVVIKYRYGKKVKIGSAKVPEDEVVN